MNFSKAVSGVQKIQFLHSGKFCLCPVIIEQTSPHRIWDDNFKINQYSVSYESVRCKNRIFPKNPVFLYISDHKIKVDKALALSQISVKGLLI